MGGLNTSLSGRLRNTNLPVTSPLFPLFEAVVNSIHSIDQRAKQEDNYKGRIDINIIRSAQTSAFGIKPDITGFEIIDNGIGFNSENYESFKTLDSEYKMDLGCRGIGRLLWLKAFKIVKLKSVYIESDKCFTRSFNFSTANGISDENVTEIPNTEIKTSIELTDLSKRYLKYLPRTIETISRNLLEHCIWYFIREGRGS